MTAVPSNSILEPESSTLTVGDYCKVKYMRTVYDGRVAAIGKCLFLNTLPVLLGSSAYITYLMYAQYTARKTFLSLPDQKMRWRNSRMISLMENTHHFNREPTLWWS